MKMKTKEEENPMKKINLERKINTKILLLSLKNICEEKNYFYLSFLVVL
jgi:hypothetical protein